MRRYRPEPSMRVATRPSEDMPRTCATHVQDSPDGTLALRSPSWYFTFACVIAHPSGASSMSYERANAASQRISTRVTRQFSPRSTISHWSSECWLPQREPVASASVAPEACVPTFSSELGVTLQFKARLGAGGSTRSPAVNILSPTVAVTE